MSKIEEVIEYYPNGIIKEKGTKKDGKSVGKWFGCYETGEKEAESNYKDGRLEEATSWYKNGNKKWERTGYYDGKETSWYENGQKKIEGLCKDGKEDGFHVIWDENGKKIWEGTFKMGDVIDDEGFPYSMFDDLNKE